MKKSEIVIRTKGENYKYVRDVVNDTYGQNTDFYGYRGNARRKLVIIYNNGIFSRNTGLLRNTKYYFKSQVNEEGAATEHSISFPGEVNSIINFDELSRRLNKISSSRFTFEWEDIDRSEEGFYFVASGNIPDTSIAITAGTTGTDLLDSLGATIGDEIVSDNIFDQTSAGQVYKDYNDLLDYLSNEAAAEPEPYFITFPESVATEYLIRQSHDGIGTEQSLSINKLVRSQIENIRIIENDYTVR